MKSEDEVIVRVNWEKVDKDLYAAMVDKELRNLELTTDISTIREMDSSIHSVNTILTTAAIICGGKKKTRKNRRKTKVWNSELKKATAESKRAHWQYKEHRSKGTLDSEIIQNRKLAKLRLRRLYRQEIASKRSDNKREIMDARREDSKLFHKLIRRQRGVSDSKISELDVNGTTYKGKNVISGWKTHFQTLATPSDNLNFDKHYIEHVQQDVDVIKDICDSSEETLQEATTEELEKAIRSLNTGKSPDVYGVTAEHILNAGPAIIEILLLIYNAIFQLQTVPDILKIGTLTPVFKRKGSKLEAKNYRGITVLPVIAKLLELLLRSRLRDIIDRRQNQMQRGFTSYSSPLYCALLIEEFIRETTGCKQVTFTAYLDAKTAFDVVNHGSLLRKLFNYGVAGPLWNILHSFHQNATSVVKWDGVMSESIHIEQGVRQGGILSADLYKVYVNQLLDRIYECGYGARIGDIVCNAPTCADDLSSLSSDSQELQMLCDIAFDYSCMEQYQLQPTKSVVLPVRSRRKKQDGSYTWCLGRDEMPTVQKTTHVGVTRSDTNSAKAAIDENIQKARKTLYSLMATGLHGENGLDPETSIHLLRTYVLPVLLYGLDIYLPTSVELCTLETQFKKIIKHILSLPTTTADPAPFILSGLIPAEGLIHLRALTLFGNITRLDADSLEKRLALRQLSVKDTQSGSWFIDIRRICVKYDLPDPLDVLSDPPSRYAWKRQIHVKINNYWKDRLIKQAELYSSLQHLSITLYNPGKVHPLLRIGQDQDPVRQANRMAVKLKLVTGTYMLQSTRSAFNNIQVDPVCVLCKTSDETTMHFILECCVLDFLRKPILEIISSILRDAFNIHFEALDSEQQLQTILDFYVSLKPRKDNVEHVLELEHHCRRLCYSLHSHRYKLMCTLPTRKRYGL